MITIEHYKGRISVANERDWERCAYAIGLYSPNYPVPAIEHAVFARGMYSGDRVLIVAHARCGNGLDLIREFR